MATNIPVTENTMIAIKVSVNDTTRKLKLPLRDLGVNILPAKLRHLLCIAPEQDVIFERFSDSAGGYITLDPTNPAVFKTLIRAAKAKLKLRLKATVTPSYDAQIKQEEEETTVATEGPVIARTPVYVAPARDSTAVNEHAVGPGIFNFRESIVAQDQSEKKEALVASEEAPLPRSFIAASKELFVEPATMGLPQELALRTRPSAASMISKFSAVSSTWSVYCNECDSAMDNVHFHCSICDGGDYDLCETCVQSGKLCPGEGHWLIKRFIASGRVISSTTERIAPKIKSETSSTGTAVAGTERDMPGAFTEDVKTLNEVLEGASRTCNGCVITLPEDEFVTCSVCSDFDICRHCHTDNKHGHHPGHHFKPAIPAMELTLAEEALLLAGRNVRHHAICDGCDKTIFGIRHKCFNCPDFDYCSTCLKGARHTHPRHRFATIYEPIPMQRSSAVRHYGVYCDGPLCKDKADQRYIHGVRYKCVVCHDTDFCAACEALPTAMHNKTHPLVKFKTPVNNLTISTESEDRSGAIKKLGDKEPRQHAEVVPAVSSSPKQATTPVKTLADFRPTAGAELFNLPSEKRAFIPMDMPTQKSLYTASQSITNPAPVPEAHFVRDTIADGTCFAPNTRFTQVWTIRNPGPNAWPAGCSVRYVGGDNMLNVDNVHASSVSDIAEATESNVVGRAVQPGEEAAFKVLMKAPSREGKCISYWRLKSAGGVPFGHRLWCDINVKSALIDWNGMTAEVSPRKRQPELPSFKSYLAHHQQQFAAIRAARDNTETLASQPTQPSGTDKAAAVEKKSEVKAAPAIEAVDEKKIEIDNAEEVDVDIDSVEVNIDIDSVKEEKVETEMKGSQMVFPTLEKESPASSTYQSMSSSGMKTARAAYAEDEDSGVKVADATVIAEPSTPSVETAETSDETFEEVSDDLEVLSADGDEDSEEDGFMTDEEYDILDASDQETVASP